MRIQISKRFVKDTQSIKDKRILNKIQQVLLQAQKVDDDLATLDNLEEISGCPNYYRIKFDYRYRIGIFYAGEAIEFLRVGSREDFYKRFP
jgi:mRNA-degrading endonuclease RelE of RelBE toxin-antitoxin system